MEHFLYAPPHLILTIPHYIGTIIPLISQMSKLRHKKLGNMAKVSARAPSHQKDKFCVKGEWINIVLDSEKDGLSS